MWRKAKLSKIKNSELHIILRSPEVDQWWEGDTKPEKKTRNPLRWSIRQVTPHESMDYSLCFSWGWAHEQSCTREEKRREACRCRACSDAAAAAAAPFFFFFCHPFDFTIGERERERCEATPVKRSGGLLCPLHLDIIVHPHAAFPRSLFRSVFAYQLWNRKIDKVNRRKQCGSSVYTLPVFKILSLWSIISLFLTVYVYLFVLK